MEKNINKVFDKILSELEGLTVPITQEDASDYRRLQIRLIDCNHLQDKVVRYLSIVEPELAKVENNYRNEKFGLECRKREIKTNDRAIKALPTGKERDEAAESLLEKDYRVLLSLENRINDFKVVKGALTTTLRKLRGTESNIKELKKLLDEQVTKLNVGKKDDPEVAELYKSLSEVDDLETELDNEIDIDDVENSEEYIENEEQDDRATHDESVQPNNESLELADSHDASDDFALELEDITNEDSHDESVQPNNGSLELADSHEEEISISESIDRDVKAIEKLTGKDSKSILQDDENVTAKQSAPEEKEEESDSDSIVIDDDLLGGVELDMDPDVGNESSEESSTGIDVNASTEKNSSEDNELDYDDLADDLLGAEDESDVDSTEEEQSVEEEKIVEDDASIGEEYDIETLLDM